MDLQEHNTQAAGSSRFEARIAHIHAICYVEQTRARTQLDTLRQTLLNLSKCGETPITNALWLGILALVESNAGLLRYAAKSGHLLMCWEGSSIVEFYDAQQAVPA